MDSAVEVYYTNYKGETGYRKVRPLRLFWGSFSPYYPDLQWLLEVIDLDKQQPRTYAMKNIQEWRPLEGSF